MLFLPSANPILAFVAARLICKRQTKHHGVVKPYQLWQVLGFTCRAKKKKEEEGEESVSMLRNVWVCVCVWCVPVCVCTLARVPTSMRVTELVCYSAVKYPEMACLQGFVRV